MKFSQLMKAVTICVLLSTTQIKASDMLVNSTIKQHLKFISEKQYLNALELIAGLEEKSHELQFLEYDLSNPRYRRKGTENYSYNFKEKYGELLFQIDNSDHELVYFKSRRDLKCAVLQAYIFEMLSGGEPAFMLRGPASSLKRCLGTGEAGYFSTFASLLIKDMVADLEDADKIPMAKSLYEASVSIVMIIQSSLSLLGYEPGPIDGLYGNKTRAALLAFELQENAEFPLGIASYEKALELHAKATAISDLSTQDALFLNSILKLLEEQITLIEQFGYFAIRPAEIRGSSGENTNAQIDGDSKLAAELKFWETVLGKNTKEFYELYLNEYPNGSFAPLAKLLLSTIELSNDNAEEAVKPIIPVGNYRALIIANEDYDYWQNLSTPIQDQARIGTILEQKFRMMVEEHNDLNRDEFLSEIYDFFKNAGPSDNLVVYYAGHGEELDETGFWIPVDAEKNKDFDWIDINHIKRYAKASKAKSILFLVDSCFSGTISRGISFQNLDRSVSSDRSLVRVAISSGKFDQNSADVGPQDRRYSPFARALYDSLRDFNEPFNSKELYDKLISNFPKDLDQEPQWGIVKNTNHSGDDFEFIITR